MSALTVDRSCGAINRSILSSKRAEWNYEAAVHHANRVVMKLYEIEDRLKELEKRFAVLTERIRVVHQGQEP